MRAIKSLDDVQIVLRDLLDFKRRVETQNFNMHGNKVVNAAAGTDPNDYVVLSQLPKQVPAPAQKDHHYTIVLSKDGIPNDGENTPPFYVQVDRVGIPTVAWVAVIGAPTSDATFQIKRIPADGSPAVNILAAPMPLLTGAFSNTVSNFIIPVMQFARGDIVYGTVLVGGNSAQISMGVVVKRTFQKSGDS